MDYLDYLDEIYEELVDEFGHEIESNCVHEWHNSQFQRRVDLIIPPKFDTIQP